MDDYREEGWGKETQWEDILLSEGKPNIDEDEILEKVKRGLRMQTLSWSHQKELAYLYDIFATLRAKMEIWCCFNPIGATYQLDIFSSLLDDEKIQGLLTHEEWLNLMDSRSRFYRYYNSCLGNHMPDYWDYDIDVADRIKWYEGETGIEDKPDGFGQAWFNDGSVYNGQWLYGAMEGHGIMEYPNGDIYEGEWKEGKCEDEEGFYLCLSDTPTRSLNMQLGDAYIGEFNDHLSKTCGEGKFVFADGTSYQGHVENGLFGRYGLYKYSGFSFEGYFLRGKPHGAGCLLNDADNDGAQLIGNWKYGERAGVFAIVRRGEFDMSLVDKSSSVCSLNKFKYNSSEALLGMQKLKVIICGGFESSLRRKVRFYIDRELSLYFKSLSVCDMNHLVKSRSHNNLKKIQNDICHFYKIMVCWVDIVPFKIKDRKGRVCQHAMVCVMGMERSGSKSLMGLYPSAATLRKVGFWKQVFKNLQKRGLDDVLVWYVDESEKLLQNVLKSFYPLAAIEVQNESYNNVSALENRLRLVRHEDEVCFSSVEEFKLYICRYISENKETWRKYPAGWAYFLNNLLERFGERYNKF